LKKVNTFSNNECCLIKESPCIRNKAQILMREVELVNEYTTNTKLT